MRARRRQSGQLHDHLSGTFVAERPDEQLAPNSPIFNALALYIAVRSRMDAVRANGQAPFAGRDRSAGRPSSLSDWTLSKLQLIDIA
jgi:hypothetical protein